MCWLKGKESILLVFAAVTLTLCPTWTSAQGSQPTATTLLDLLNRNADIKEFAKIANQSQYFTVAVPFRGATLFVPTNDAVKEFQKNGGKFDDYVINYHLANVAKLTNELEDSINSDLPGNLPIWVTKRNGEIYLNDAKILVSQPEKAKSKTGMDQYMYKIDRVLEPTQPSSNSATLLNPDARRFLENHGQFNIVGNLTLSDFAHRVGQVGELDTFSNAGKHTFFIPIDEALKKPSVKKAISAKVVEGHVIPNEVIFLRLAEPGKEFATEAFPTDLKVLISIENRSTEGANTWIVQSDTRVADANHRKGLVQTEIIRGNIPVKNGVVHIISKPLVVIDETVFQTLATFSVEKDGKSNGGLTQEFVNTLKDMGPEIFERINQGNGNNGITVFVPTNEAMQEAKASLERLNTTKLHEILKLHIVMGLLSSDNIAQQHHNDSENYQVMTLAAGKKLFFNMVDDGNTRTFYVEGGGVNATITKPDIAATDGVIHLINKVLGFADLSVYEKLRTDPMLKETFAVTSPDEFNYRFKNPNLKYTIFAPSNEAWRNQWYRDPSGHKKLVDGQHGYHVQVIMRRHIIVGEILTIEEMYERSKDPKAGIHTISQDLVVKYKNETGKLDPYPHQKQTTAYDYVVYWGLEYARVIRPNINCTNGIIHVIDNVLMVPEDVTVARTTIGGGSAPSTAIATSSFAWCIVTYYFIHWIANLGIRGN